MYHTSGDPKSVLSVVTYPDLPSPPPQSLNVRYVLSPVNPSDINVIEGVYPSKPTKTDALTAQGKGSEGQPVFVGGNEGLAQVVAVGEGVKPEYLKEGDWVVVTKQQSGTWMTERNIPVVDVARVPNADKLTEADIRLYTTIVRFDPVYFTHFKCNYRTIRDGYPHINRWMQNLYWNDKAFKDTTDFDSIKAHYFQSHTNINPHRIVPEGPVPHILPLDK